MSYRFAAVPSWSCSQAEWHIAVWHMPLLCVQWKTPDKGQRNCPQRVEFYSKNKFEKLVHLFGFITRTILSVISSVSLYFWFRFYVIGGENVLNTSHVCTYIRTYITTFINTLYIEGFCHCVVGRSHQTRPSATLRGVHYSVVARWQYMYSVWNRGI